ncbi:MAG: helix-turn-helix domain-containing protein [Candidatus Omnitrophica bacterium]|jgi:predicted transcriptional regulator|nr:helix-turn-helix domain-containing protein [Candidatus Omnitrophota bacterium]
MEKGEYFSIAQVAKILKISRIAVYKKVKKGEMAAIRIGKIYAIPKENILRKIRKIKGHTLSSEDVERIKRAVDKTIKDYGEVLKKLGSE